MNEIGTQIRGDHKNPYHLSVGAVVTNNNLVVLIKKGGNFYTLPRETIYSLENVHGAVQRGLEEEVGINSEVVKFLGSVIEHFNRSDGTKVEKTTLYFLCEKASDYKEDETDEEVIWVENQKALELLKKCGNEEYNIVDRAFNKT